MDILEGWAGLELSDAFAESVEKHFYLAKNGVEVVGTGMINARTGKIDAIFVHPNHMRKGIGKAVIKFLEGVALNHGLKTVTLQSTLNAAAFYRTCGFVGDEIKTYTTSQGMTLDCIPMTKGIARDR